MPSSIAQNWVLVALVGMYSMAGQAAEPSPTASVQADHILRESVAGVEGEEIIMSRVSFPPHTELPWHWHSGEEFFYVIEGSITLKRRGEPDLLAEVGDAQKIAAQAVHTGSTGEHGAELVIFRVHTSGKSERYLVD